MDLYKTIHCLRQEQKRLDQVIASLEELHRVEVNNDIPSAPARRRGRKSMDAAARQEVSERMKKYWAARRKQAVHN